MVIVMMTMVIVMMTMVIVMMTMMMGMMTMMIVIEIIIMTAQDNHGDRNVISPQFTTVMFFVTQSQALRKSASKFLFRQFVLRVVRN